VLLINIIVTIVEFVRDPRVITAWIVLVAVALAIGIWTARMMALRAQDRIIRLEERARLERLLPPHLRERLGDLTTSQFIAIRFAPDEEVADLVARALTGELRTQGEIKRAIRNWRADHLRV
jgi:L-cystine uptake protein TcyP (sodium:dicarboxylate symporter family)